jgi:imidazolonepropionase-like amidohydrolase
MRLQATNAVEEGVSPDDALKAVTINSARIMGIDKRVGSLEKGKDADLVILSGPPFTGGTRVEAVVVNGSIVWKQ